MLAMLNFRVASGTKGFLLGLGVTAAYYFFVHQPFMRDSILHAYTTHHITEYAIVMLFFWANAEHFYCYRKSSRELNALDCNWLPERRGLEEPEHAQVLLENVLKKQKYLGDTMMYRRLHSALRFVFERRSADGFREYLESLSSRDSDEVFHRYAFSRFVTAILPIMGLIGTVVHFGTALGGLTLEGLNEKLPNVLSGMGTAFNTTFTAMSGLAVTMLIRFLIERRENSAVTRIDAFVEDELLYRFQSVDSSLTPFIDAIDRSQSRLMEALGNYEARLAGEWANRFELSRSRWEKADQRQENLLVQLLHHMAQHQQTNIDDIKQVRDDLVTAQNMMTEVANTLIADGQLLDLQDRLVENLTVLRQSQQLENAMHELTAAIHLFTARQSSTSAQRSAA